MSKQKAPAFQLYVKDFLAGTSDMSNAEAGAYIRLLCHQWDKGFLPKDDKILIRFCCGDPEGIETAKSKFSEEKDGTLINKRLDSERKQKAQFLKSQSVKGSKGAEKRWKKDDSQCHAPANGQKIATAIKKEWPDDSSATATSTATSYIISKQAVVECLCRATPQGTAREIIEMEADELLKTYQGQRIKNLQALCNKWAGNIKDHALVAIPKKTAAQVM